MFEIDVVTPKPAQVRLKSSQNVSLVSCNIMGHDVLQILIDIAKSEKRPPTSPPPPPHFWIRPVPIVASL